MAGKSTPLFPAFHNPPLQSSIQAKENIPSEQGLFANKVLNTYKIKIFLIILYCEHETAQAYVPGKKLTIVKID